jgi:hypothetical protein
MTAAITPRVTTAKARPTLEREKAMAARATPTTRALATMAKAVSQATARAKAVTAIPATAAMGTTRARVAKA